MCREYPPILPNCSSRLGDWAAIQAHLLSAEDVVIEVRIQGRIYRCRVSLIFRLAGHADTSLWNYRSPQMR